MLGIRRRWSECHTAEEEIGKQNMKEEFCLSFENKVALVTGVGSGMGLATPKAFAEAGASVLLADANEKLVRATAKIWLPQATKQFPSAAMLPRTSKWAEETEADKIAFPMRRELETA